MLIMSTILGIALIVTLIVGSNYLVGLFAAKTKQEMQCIFVESSDLISEVRSVLQYADIYFSDMIWSPSQTAYNQLGAAQRTPAEIWVRNSDVNRTRQVLELRYKIEITATAIVVHEKE